jgi:hypothetical protein
MSSSRPDIAEPACVGSCRTWSFRIELLQHDGDRDQDAKKPDEHQADAPAEGDHQHRHHRRRGREAQVAAERVQSEGAAHAVLVHRPGEDRVVARMEHRIAGAGQQREHGDLPEAGGEAHGDDAERHQQRAADQEPARTVTIHQEAEWRLAHRGSAGHKGDGQTHLGEGHVERRLPRQEQRRHAQRVEV